MSKKISIAIDGPASAGKSTVAKILAKELHYVYCDTGAMYRAITYQALVNDVDVHDEQALVQLLQKTMITFEPHQEGQKVFVNQQEVTQVIRKPQVTNQVSHVSVHKGVREELVRRQQKIAECGGIVMDGRDIGTAVLPNAEVKIFLIASVEERAERRFLENQKNGIDTPLEKLKEEIATRDHIDSTRKISPLVQAKDAILVDTTGLNIPEVVTKIKEIVSKQVKFA
ncbi:cytidylate kinase [Isobaculum melis]|uniref:Cytidylate kinase n=1 Tax=Isobaculum melis TaxID=142588 RepID=A0A1H9R853_9LACT|nr:cytidylate kinase [Isobaculum melis]